LISHLAAQVLQLLKPAAEGPSHHAPSPNPQLHPPPTPSHPTPKAAYSLPRWLKPEIGAGRVWLHRGQLHVVPLPSVRNPTLPAAPDTAEALAIVRSEGVATRMPKWVAFGLRGARLGRGL